MALPSAVRLLPEVADALAEGRPVVALESTIIAHGMPYPQNVETARRVEGLIRAGGAVPATIAVVDGAIQVGLDADLLERLGTADTVAKLSRRDLPMAIATKRLGATTVATTMIGASLAGISIFVTGGIGGVHRGAEQSFDISADLTELSRTNVGVVCAGAKSILDLPKTLETLETLGVPVIGYQTDRFPPFYARTSDLPVDHRAESAAEIAAILAAKWALGLDGGAVIANPAPAETALPADEIETYIAQAIAEARAQGVRGKAETPFLLKRITELTGGRSLAANIALVENNAHLGAAIAVALAGRRAFG
ncbi:pseudouridine-5'-phosphate glycosidase [Elstera litoralis]|uniref:Pseudouridine-5'-phosphate glycosidase n=1 Tax=Elstera litoralis TaxID=552518 RepID=A0A0F3IUY5_9PROT|nr:pseudouridine-5'-phosphate glycosidase [Elstera litoralis]KJV09414.1 pseudouridine-5'-phosphate glycosidase [Elstera litoralis]